MTFRLNETVSKAFHDETYRGLPENTDLVVTVGSKSEGRVAEVGLELDESHKIQAVGFKAFGDTYLIATFSWLCRKIHGQNLKLLATLTVADIATALELPQYKIACALLAEDCLTQIMEAYNARK